MRSLLTEILIVALFANVLFQVYVHFLINDYKNSMLTKLEEANKTLIKESTKKVVEFDAKYENGVLTLKFNEMPDISFITIMKYKYSEDENGIPYFEIESQKSIFEPNCDHTKKVCKIRVNASNEILKIEVTSRNAVVKPRVIYIK